MAFLFGAAEFLFNAAMIGGPIAAGGVQAGFDADNINKTCSELEDAKKNYNQVKSKIKNFTKNAASLEEKQDIIAKQLAASYAQYKGKLKVYKELFKTQQLSKDIMFAIFIFCLIVTLLFKYFKVIPNIYNLIVGNK